jgi:hypothetical protein
MINNIEDILGKPSEPSNFSTFGDFTPYERQMIMAELYHNAWYNQERFEQMYDLYNKWSAKPIKEFKFILPENNEDEKPI